MMRGGFGAKRVLMDDVLALKSAFALKELVAKKAISPVALTRQALRNAEATQPSLNAFFAITADEAMCAAKSAESAVMNGQPLGLLHGLPLSIKDLIAVKDAPFAFGSRAMAANIADVDAPATERVKAAGGIIIGKTTTSEFGCKPVGDSPLTGTTRHPWNLGKTPGGSSAGAAASVAAGITPFALGTDGGGSLRIPAALTGLVGFKASFGRVPVWPTSATPTLAHVGPVARDVRDAALLLTAVAGYDARDPFSIAGPVPDFLAALNGPVKGKRIAWSPTFGYARPSADVVKACEDAVKTFEGFGCQIEQVDRLFDSDPADLWTAEFYAGVGARLEKILERQRDLLDPAVAAILDHALRQDMRAYYQTVFKRYDLREKIRKAFERFDLILSPTVPVSSLDAGKNLPDHLGDRNLVSWVYYTYPFNLTGNPAASICAGFGDDGMPVGLQIVGGPLAEVDVIAAAAAFERSKVAGYNVRPFAFPG
jgi:aspartyl-tRNA(Asn)/glutamyl-tRNA(Gln) amidotransferase subunit A